MARPRSTSFTLSGTRHGDELAYLDGRLSLNGAAVGIPNGMTKVTLSAGAGNDRVVTDTPHSAVGMSFFYDGGRGSDTLDFSHATTGVAVRLMGYAQTVSTNFTLVDPHDTPEGQYYDLNDPIRWLDITNGLMTNNIANFESVIGSAHNDYILLSSVAAGTAEGGGGDDWISGGIGSDLLSGGDGNDYIEGRAGNDTMSGGAGADQFQVLTMNGHEIITDFKLLEDWLFVGQQEGTHAVPDASTWVDASYTDSSGVLHARIQSSFEGGSVTLDGLTLADVESLMARTTVYDWFG